MLTMKNLSILISLILFLIFSGCAQQDGSQASQDTSVSITNTGSDTIVNLALAWAEKYQENHSEVRISVTGGGSGTGLAALINNTVDIANASRSIKPEETENAKKTGFELTEFIIARDAIAVIVNPENPINELTLEQIALIYRGEINNWSELGGENRPIVRLSRESNSGTHVYFLETVVRMGNSEDKSIFSPTTLLLPSSEGIIAEVRDNPNAIGYDGLGYITPDVKPIGIAIKPGELYVMPTIETVNDNSYPISRDLYMYTHNNPRPAIVEYIDWIQSTEAQKIVKELGFVPLIEKQ